LFLSLMARFIANPALSGKHQISRAANFRVFSCRQQLDGAGTHDKNTEENILPAAAAQ
jgi:hypothetical protein